MRLAIPFALLLATTTGAPRQGCGEGVATAAATAPAYDPCAGKACGETCHSCPPDARDCVETMVVKACDPFHRCVPQVAGMCDAATGAPRQGCGGAGAGAATPPGYDPCAGKACGDTCTACAPDDRDCVETMVVKACDPLHRCVTKTEGLCAAATDPCSGKACGAACTIDPPCRSATPPCMMPSLAGFCDAAGSCVAGTQPPGCAPRAPPPPSWGCVGKACGDSCGFCPDGTDPSRCPVPTFAATACDAQLQCVTAGTFTCPR